MTPNSFNAFHDGLLPPLETSYFRRQEVTVYPELPFQHANVSWSAEIYTYVSGAKPDDPDFRKNGGLITIVMVHSGSVEIDLSAAGAKGSVLQKVKPPGSVMAYRQLPSTDSGKADQDTWQYDIDYSQTLPMFRNGGTEAFSFESTYRESFSMYKAEQKGDVDGNVLEFSVAPTNSTKATYPLRGLSIFRCEDPSAFPLKFDFGVTFRYHSGGSTDEASVEMDRATVELPTS